MTEDAHARPTGATPEPLYDINVATPTHAERARTLVTQASTGTLCSLAIEPAGHPYGLVCDGGVRWRRPGVPFERPRRAQPRTSSATPVRRCSWRKMCPTIRFANGRVTLLGSCRPVEGDPASERVAFLHAHPHSAYYADFRDFGFWRLGVESVRYIGGYGRMSWVEKAAWEEAEPDPLAASAAGVVTHMNADHADAMVDYCVAFSKATEVASATMTNIDRYGFEMSAVTSEGPRPVRLAFPQAVTTPQQARDALIRLLKQARAHQS